MISSIFLRQSKQLISPKTLITLCIKLVSLIFTVSAIEYFLPLSEAKYVLYERTETVIYPAAM